MRNDSELLRGWVESRSEADMAELVQRHLGLVYHAALRRTGGNETLAKDVAQDVFVATARQAGSLANHPMITGWLFTTTRNVATKFLRAQDTRRHYEQEAVTHQLTAEAPQKDWDRLRPVIDDALDSLESSEREAILARYFQGQAFAEIGRVFGISADAARMRSDRALDKLRVALERRGIGSVSAALATVLATQSGLAVPANVIVSVSGAATAAGTVAAAGSIFGFLTAAKTVAVTATAVAVAIGGVAVVEHNRAQQTEADLAALKNQQASLVARLTEAQSQVRKETSRGDQADADIARLLVAIEQAKTEREATAAAAAAAAIEAKKKASAIAAKEAEDAKTIKANEYVLVRGDTGLKIAEKNGVTLEELLRLNPDVVWSRLKVGQKVRIKEPEQSGAIPAIAADSAATRPGSPAR